MCVPSTRQPQKIPISAILAAQRLSCRGGAEEKNYLQKALAKREV
jgi:hypothetical protein